MTILCPWNQLFLGGKNNFLQLSTALYQPVDRDAGLVENSWCKSHHKTAKCHLFTLDRQFIDPSGGVTSEEMIYVGSGCFPLVNLLLEVSNSVYIEWIRPVLASFNPYNWSEAGRELKIHSDTQHAGVILYKHSLAFFISFIALCQQRFMGTWDYSLSACQ